jgi:hypothetical protein
LLWSAPSTEAEGSKISPSLGHVAPASEHGSLLFRFAAPSDRRPLGEPWKVQWQSPVEEIERHVSFPECGAFPPAQICQLVCWATSLLLHPYELVQ